MSDVSIIWGEKVELPTRRIHREFEALLQTVDNNGRLVAFKEAVRDDKESRVFAELNDEANQLARMLLQNIQMDRYQKTTRVVVGIYMNASIERLVAILSVVKLAAIFVPLSPDFPEGRTRYIIETASVDVVLVNKKVDSRKLKYLLADATVKVLDYNDLRCQALQAGLSSRTNLTENEEFPGDKTTSAVLSILFTSGTTGKPKGVPITHRAVLNMVTWQENSFSLGSEEINSHQVNFVSVASSSEIFGSLLRGKPLVIITEKSRSNPMTFIENVENQNINRIFSCFPGLAQNIFLILKSSNQNHLLSSVRAIQIGGEIVPPQVISNFLEHNNYTNAVVTNGYGMTESTMLSLSQAFRTKDDILRNIRDGKVAIGSPTPNNIVYIVNDQLEPVRHGDVGQICVSGVNVSPGYLSDELNSDTFRPNHILQQPGHEVLLCTGDYGAIHGGVVYYEGRKQSRLKIRGYRVSTIEVEETIMQVSGVKRAAAFGYGKSDTDTIVVAYYSCESGAIVSAEEILQHCRGELPEYSIPRLRRVEEMPVRPPQYKIDYPTLQKMFEESLAKVDSTNISKKEKHSNDNKLEGDTAKEAKTGCFITDRKSKQTCSPFTVRDLTETSDQEKELILTLYEEWFGKTQNILIRSFTYPPNHLRDVAEKSLLLAEEDKISFILVDKRTGNIVALALVLSKNPDISIEFIKAGDYEPMWGLWVELEGSFVLAEEELPGKTAWGRRFVADPTLPVAEVMEILNLCLDESIRRAKENGFEKFLIGTPHTSIQEIMAERGAKLHKRMHLSSYEMNGERPYASIPPDAYACCYVLDLKNQEDIHRKINRKQLLDIIAAVLNIPSVSCDMKLYEMGANSENIVRIWNKLADAGFSISVDKFLQVSAVADIIRLVEVGQNQDTNLINSSITREEIISVIAETLIMSPMEVESDMQKSFLEMGGNSVNATKAWSMLKSLGHPMSFEQFLFASSINQIAAGLEKVNNEPKTETFAVVSMKSLTVDSTQEALNFIIDSYERDKSQARDVFSKVRKDTYDAWVNNAWVKTREKDLSFAIRDTRSGRIASAGFLTSENLDVEGMKDKAVRSHPDVVAFVKETDGSFIQEVDHLPGKTLWASRFGIDPDLPIPEVFQLMVIAVDHCIRIGRKEGFARLHFLSFHPSVQAILYARGAKDYKRVYLSTFEYDGKKPFAHARDDLYIATIILDL